MRGVNRRRLLLLVAAAAAGLVLLGILGAANYAAAQRRAAAFSLKPTSRVPRPTATPSAVPNRLKATCATPASIARADDLWVAGARDQTYAVLTLNRTEVPVFGSRPHHVIVAGDLSVVGATHPVAVAVDAQTVAGGVQAVGSMAIDAHDFGIRLPGEGDPIAVDSHLTLEFLLVLEQVDHQTGAN